METFYIFFRFNRFLTVLLALVVGAANAQHCDSTSEAAKTGLIDLTVAQLKKKTDRSDKLVILNFTADWCVVCKKQGPILDEVKLEQKNVCEILTIDMECNPLIAEQYEVDALPTFLLFKQGYLALRQEGLMSKSNLLEIIKKYE